MPSGHFPVEVLQACPAERRTWSRPRTCWRDDIFHLTWECLRILQEHLEQLNSRQDKETPDISRGSGDKTQGYNVKRCYEATFLLCFQTQHYQLTIHLSPSAITRHARLATTHLLGQIFMRSARKFEAFVDLVRAKSLPLNQSIF